MRIAIIGKQGSGKTHFANIINKSIHIPIIDIYNPDYELKEEGIFCFQEKAYCKEEDFDYVIKISKNGN